MYGINLNCAAAGACANTVFKAGSIFTCSVADSCTGIDTSALTGGETDGCAGDHCPDGTPMYNVNDT